MQTIFQADQRIIKRFIKQKLSYNEKENQGNKNIVNGILVFYSFESGTKLSLFLKDLHDQISTQCDLEKKMQSLNNSTNPLLINSPPSSQQKDKSKFSKYRGTNYSMDGVDGFVEVKKKEESPKVLQKSALKSSSRRFFNDPKESKVEDTLIVPPQVTKTESNNYNFNIGLQRVSSKNLDDEFEEKANKNSNDPSKQGMNSFKNSFEDLPRFRRQSSISKSLRMSYISQRKKSIIATQDIEEEEKMEDKVIQKRLLVRQRRSRLINKIFLKHFSNCWRQIRIYPYLFSE